MMTSFVFFTFLVLFTLFSGYCSLALIALFSLSTGEAKIFAQDPDKRKRLVVTLLSSPRDLLVTLLFYDIAANILIQNTAANLFGDYSSWLLKVGVPLVLTLILGEILPKTIALPFNTQIAHRVAPSVFFLHKLLGPIRRLITNVTTHVSRLLFFFLKKEKEISNDELRVLLRSSESYGILSREEAKLAQGYLSLADITVKERMRPRHEILYYDLSEPLTKLIFLFVEKECSKVPVCQEDIQNLRGILSAKHFFLHRNEIKESKDLSPYLKKPYYVPETIVVRTLLRHFFQRKEEIAIVVDEYSSISGLITQEDLFEIVVGEIADRRDEKMRYTPAGKDVIIASGKFELSEFEELFQVQLPSENNMVTLGGWLTEQLGTIPKSGTKYVWKNFLFQVLAADANRVRRIYIRRLKPHE
jgi:putative hemolysin